jgi:hypothetical protein
MGRVAEQGHGGLPRRVSGGGGGAHRVEQCVRRRVEADRPCGGESKGIISPVNLVWVWCKFGEGVVRGVGADTPLSTNCSTETAVQALVALPT